MHHAMINEVAEAILADRRREAARQRRVSAARRQRRARQPVPAWRVRFGRALITAGSSIGGRPVRNAVSRNTGGAC